MTVLLSRAGRIAAAVAAGCWLLASAPIARAAAAATAASDTASQQPSTQPATAVATEERKRRAFTTG